MDLVQNSVLNVRHDQGFYAVLLDEMTKVLDLATLSELRLGWGTVSPHTKTTQLLSVEGF